MRRPIRGTGPPSRRRRLPSAEVTGGGLLLLAAALALVLANSPLAQGYAGVRDFYVGRDVLGLDLRLSVRHWAADGLLAVFFFLVGLELKRELVVGQLRNPRQALVPVVAAIGGVVLPALIFVAVNAGNRETLGGWAIPVATDIAIALAVLALVARRLPAALRTFLLTLAVVDDLIAITIIAVFYTSGLEVSTLIAALVPLLIFAFFARHYAAELVGPRWLGWVFLLPAGLVCWALVHESGLHATLAGVALAMTVPVRDPHNPEVEGLAQALEHRIQPFSAWVCVPVFAFFSAGVALGGVSGLADSLRNPAALGIVVALVLGKIVGITGAAWLITRFKVARLDESLVWIEVLGLASLAGIGFTVSLLITELSYPDSSLQDVAKVGVLVGSLIAAGIGATILGYRDRRASKPSTARDLDTQNPD